MTTEVSSFFPSGYITKGKEIPLIVKSPSGDLPIDKTAKNNQLKIRRKKHRDKN